MDEFQICIFIERGELHEIKDFFEKHNVNVKMDRHNNNSLMLASIFGHLHIVKFLIEKGALLNLQRKDRSTALDLASMNGRLEVVMYLISKGATSRKTAIKQARIWSNMRVLEFLKSVDF